MPDGTIRNAPHIANETGQSDKVMRINTAGRKVDMVESLGYANGELVKYISTDASDPAAAALENSTYTPALNAAPTAGGDGTDSARATLAALVNGQTGISNPQRQGLNSALLDGADPLNLLFWTPNQGRYSPLWDVHLAQWSAAAVAAGSNFAQKDRSQLLNVVGNHVLTGPGGATFGPAGFIVNCPIISSNCVREQSRGSIATRGLVQGRDEIRHRPDASKNSLAPGSVGLPEPRQRFRSSVDSVRCSEMALCSMHGRTS